MFGFQKYLDKLFQIKWYFDEKKLHDIEQICYVKFKQANTDGKDPYFLLDKILYTYVDILLGLEDMEFTFSKQNDDYILKIIKI